MGRPTWPAASAAGLVAVGLTCPASAQQTLTGLNAPRVFALADAARANGRTADAAALYDALARDPDPDIRAEARFRKGMMLADLRHYGEAATAFRALLDEKPNAVRVRLELARVLALMGDDAGARRAIRQVQATGLPDDVAGTVNQFARALRSTRPFGGSVQVALAPDSNINRATAARTLDTIIAPLTLSSDARARSGVGVKLSGQGYTRIPITDDLSLLPRASTLGNLYRTSMFDDVSASALIGLEWKHGRDRWSPSIGATQRWYGGETYARTVSATVDWLHPLGRRAQLVVHGGAATTTYRVNYLQNGGLYDAAIGYEAALSVRSGIEATLSGLSPVGTGSGLRHCRGWFQSFRMAGYWEDNRDRRHGS